MKIFDLHNDFLTGCDNCVSQLNLYKQKNNEVVSVYFRGGNTLAKAILDINNFLFIKKENTILALEDIGYTDICKIDYILRFIPFYVSLTWNGENNLGYGCNYQNCGLKEEGKILIKKINSYKIVLDTAHISKKGFYDIIDRADNVMCSHTALNSFYKHKRNVTDEQVKIIIEKGGIIGLALYSDFYSNNPVASINLLIKQIDYFVNKFGCNNLCFGTDFYGAKNFVGGINNYEKMLKIVEKLKKIGYNNNDIEKIFYKNAKDFLEKTNGRQRFI